MAAYSQKTKALLSFLEATATLRRKRISAYGEGDKLLWLDRIPRDLPQTWKDSCRSAFVADNPADIPDLWLEIRKEPKPILPALPEELHDWVPQKFQNSQDEYVDKQIDELFGLLNQRVTVVVDKSTFGVDLRPPDTLMPVEKVSEERRLVDRPEVQNLWLEYLVNKWEPWTHEMHRWKQIQELYEDVDFMRRRLEEAEERYELLLAIGLLKWRDKTGETVKRHLLTAPAEISLDATRGILTVGPAASFEKFRVELDMLELQDRPSLEGTDLEGLLEELDVRAWDKAKVAEILRLIANKASADAQVSEDVWAPLEHPDATFRVSYAPALVLREQRPTAYEELVKRFLQASKDESTFSTTAPWDRFISEGEQPDIPTQESFDAAATLVDSDDRLYMPLSMNDEQREIVERLRRRPYVLVKGPPGTGKSQTIANLICHFLATGQRVLVTAHAPKALTVLRDLLPTDIRNLCVIAPGSSREDYRLLENSVRGILSRKNEWRGQEWAQGKIDRLERELRQFEDAIAMVDRELRECREEETTSHTLPGEYRGTAAQIARKIERERETYGWFPALIDDQTRCPLSSEDVAFLSHVHEALTHELLNELSLEIGAFSLPNPAEFAAAVERLNATESVAKAALEGLGKDQLRTLQRLTDTRLGACRTLLNQLEEQATRARHCLGDLAGAMLKDLLVGQSSRWDRLEAEARDLAGKIEDALHRVDMARVQIPLDRDRTRLLTDAQRRLEHLKNGGWRGFGSLAPRVMRETRYIEKRCRVNGEIPRQQKSLNALIGYLELQELLDRFSAVWPSIMPHTPPDSRRVARELCDVVEQLSQLLEFFRSCDREALDVVPIESRDRLAERDERATWRRSIEAELALRGVDHARTPFQEWAHAIRDLPNQNVHPCLTELTKAVEERDLTRWRTGWETRERIRKHKECLLRYNELLDRIEAVCPELGSKVRSTQGDPEWAHRLRQLQQAWDWAAARAWLRKVTAPNHYVRLTEKRHRLQTEIEQKLQELTAFRAWRAFLIRLDDRTEQNLTAWTKAVALIGKGTGKYAYRHQTTARKYLMSCIPKMPAWIMPLHKLWETVAPTPGVFDTVIVDEASQAGIESLVLLLLAKRIIVVGDDKQNSPEAVGVREDDIARLARDYLDEFHFREMFRPDTSLYDHAERAFGNAIALREHFRCVPEIIRFSNELCYTDAPLIPLRQPPPDRLPPLKEEFVREGNCEGKEQWIFNRAEAMAIAKRIQECLNNEAYNDKTMGVIVLQGHAQAEHIERMLAEVLEPRARAERKLRCGVPATFQGDQRDVIFLSLVVAPNHHFKALTDLDAVRRFNVAMSRARDQVWLFHSVQTHDLSRKDLRWQLLSFFYSRDQSTLERLYEERNRLEREALRRPRERGSQPDPYESWFEVDIALELLRRRYRVRPQYEVAGYRVDLVVEGLSNRLAVECDGEAWHGPERFEHDMARQRQLERVGWTFVRIRESEFYANRKEAAHRIVEACEELGIRPIGEEQCEIDEESGASAAEDKLWSGDFEVYEEEHGESDKSEEEASGKIEQNQERLMAGYSKELSFPDPRDASAANVRAALRQIIEREGPLPKRLLMRLYVAACPALQRAGKNTKRLLNRVLSKMEKAGEIVIEDELGDRSLESQVLRLASTPRIRERPAGGRDLMEIPASEIYLVLDRLQIQADPTNDESLMRGVLQHYGFSRLTETRRGYLSRIIRMWRERT